MNAKPVSLPQSTSTAGDGSTDDQPRAEGTRVGPAAGRRALVFGGGGSAGNAWLIGVVAGMGDAGLHVAQADLVIGTSAGSTAAAQVTSADPAGLLADILAAVPPQQTAPPGAGSRRGPDAPVVDHQERTRRIIEESGDPADMRRRLSAAALELDAASDGSWQPRWRATVASRLPSQGWPRQPLLVTAVDARSAEAVVFDRRSGVDLADAIAASCASGPPYRIGDDRYLDGGYRRNENADLAAGYERVLVLSPLGGRTRTPMGWDQHLAAQVDELRAGGSTVQTVLPDPDSLEAFGTNLMDVSRRPGAARAGHRQGRAVGERLSELWC